MKIIIPLTLTIGITIYLLVGRPSSLPVEWLLLLIDIMAGFITLSFFLAPMYVETYPTRKVTPLVPRQALSSHRLSVLSPIPRTVQGILTTMNDQQFEYFCAALIIGLREGYTFVMRCGGTGDQGADIIMKNAVGLRIVLQAKQWTDRTVGSKEVREFSGTLIHYKAIAGFFVTTSTFSRDAWDVINQDPIRIRAIDKTTLERYLQTRSHEIALAWQEIIEQTGLVE